VSSFGRRHLCFLGIKFLLAIINNKQIGDFRCQDAAAGGIVTVAFSVCFFCFLGGVGGCFLLAALFL
jgi:hypothetical protein